MSKAKGQALIGRQDLLDWINSLLGLNYMKVDETANGAAFCQVLDAINPGTVSLGRVNFNAYSEPDIFENYKILQEAFDKNKIRQNIDVEALARKGYQAALELLQFLYGYYQSHIPSGSYDPIARRKQYHLREPSQSQTRSSAAQINSKYGSRKNLQKQYQKAPISPKVQKPKSAIGSTSNEAMAPNSPPRPPATAISNVPASSSNDDSTLHRELKKKNKEIESLKEEVEQMVQEKEFYFNKLRRIEDYCQDCEEEQTEDQDIIHNILQILYEQDPENGFVTPEEDD